MIRCQSVRSDMRDLPSQSERTVTDALTSLVTYQFGYGGQVKDVHRDGDTVALLVHTPILGHTDEVTYVGSRAEMASLLRAAYYHMELTRRHGRPIMEAAMDQVAAVTQRTILVTNLFNLVSGGSLAKGVYLMLLGEAYAPHMDRLRCLPLADLSDLVTLALEGTPPEEILALCA